MSKLADSVTLLLIARLSMAAVGPLFGVSLLYAELRLSNIDAKAESAVEIGNENSEDIDNISDSVLKISTDIENRKDLRDAQYAEILGSIDAISTKQRDDAETLQYIKAQVDILISREGL